MPLPLPLGGEVREAIVDRDRAALLREQSRQWPSLDLTSLQLGDLDLLVSGALSPLSGFMSRREAEAVASTQRLPSGVFFPFTITLKISAELAARLAPTTMLALRDEEGVMLAALEVEDVWQSGTDERERYVGGRVHALQRPGFRDFPQWLPGPATVRAELQRRGTPGLAIAAPHPFSGADLAAAVARATELGAILLVQGTVDLWRPSSATFARVRELEAALDAIGPEHAILTLLPRTFQSIDNLHWRAVVSRNFGCDWMLVGRDEARGVDVPAGIKVVELAEMVYLAEQRRFVAAHTVSPPSAGMAMAPAEIIQRLAAGEEIPNWYAPPAVIDALREAHPPRHRQGFTVFFTGLSGSGKSTIASRLYTRLSRIGPRHVTLLDGDIVRKHLSSELGFSRAHRDINVRRIGFVASEITKHGGAAICAPIAPYRNSRQAVRDLVTAEGGFVLVYVATPLAVCESRDRKGLYAKARAGLIPEFTGVTDPYEPPEDADVTIDTSDTSVDQAVEQVLARLRELGFLA
jgi:sulfate adenylyltransferase